MKKTFTLFFLLFFGFTNAQTKLLLQYDDAGNQKKRVICFGNCQDLEQRPAAQNKSITEVTDEDLVEFSDAISYYPNPVREELYVKWELAEDKTVTSIDVYSANGQLLKSIVVGDKVNMKSIYFGNYPVGNYLLLLNFSNGQQETLQIIKK